MKIKIEKLIVDSEKNSLKDVVEKAVVLLKEFDDSSVDYNANPNVKKPIEIIEEVTFGIPKEDSFVSIDNVTSDVALTWIEAKTEVMYVFNKIMENAVKKEKMIAERQKLISESLQKQTNSVKKYEITF
jgi:hypothetical protein